MNPRTEKVYASQRKKMVSAVEDHLKEKHDDLDTLTNEDKFSLIFQHTEGMEMLDDFLQGIENMNTRKNYYANVVSFLKHHNFTDDAIDKYRSEMLSLCATMNNVVKQQQKTQKQDDSWQTLKQIRETMKQQKKTLQLIKEPTWRDIQPLFVSMLYLGDDKNPPIRNEYGDMVVVYAKDGIHLQDKSRNYLVITGRIKKEFILNDYKTIKTHGTKVFRVGNKLNSFINAVLKHHPISTGGVEGVSPKPEAPLLYNSVNKSLGRNGLTKYLQKHLKLSTAMLRHIYISEKVEMPLLKEKQALADKMCHSTQLQELYKKENVSE